MLRRKRGADYDLSDSDDGGEARKRMKRRQFAKMQKALFADERIKKIAEKPGNQAFLRTIEDRDSDDEMDFLDGAPESMDTEESESQEADSETVPDSQPGASRQPLGAGVSGNRAPANMRRTKASRKPTHIGDIQESVSSLLEDPNASVIPVTELDSDSDADDETRQRSPGSSNKENRSPNRRRGRHAIIDRISLKRQPSSSSSLPATARLAFAAPSAGSLFKVPALLRRATTNSLKSTSSTSSGSGTSTPGSGAGGFGPDEGKIKKVAGKQSGVNYFARETERRAVMAERETRREAKKWKGAERRVKAVGGLFGAGKFE